MNFEPLPENLEAGVKKFAKELHISREQAVLKLISSGLQVRGPVQKTAKAADRKPGLLLIGQFAGADDLAIFEDAQRLFRGLRETHKLRDFWT